MPISSSYPAIDFPEKHLFAFLFDRKDKPFPDDQAIFIDAADSSRQYTYKDIKQNAIDFGKGLKSNYDFQKGDVLAVFSPNDVDFPALTLGTLWAGGVVSPANPGYTAGELSYQLKDSGAKLVATQLALLDVVRKACKEASIPESQIILLGPQKDDSYKFKHFSSVRPLSGTLRYRMQKVSAKTDLAFLVYSSGTTGKPKGVRLSHFNITSNILQIMVAECGNLSFRGSKPIQGIHDAPERGDTMLTCLPFFHIYGLTHMVLTPMYTGVRNIVMARFDLEHWCRLVKEHQVTFAYIVPPIVVLLSKSPVVDKYDLSSLRMTNSGAAPLTREVTDAVYKRKGIRVKQGYGLSETSPTIFGQQWEMWNGAVGSVGPMVPGLEAKFCLTPGSEGYDEKAPPEIEQTSRERTGELYVRGPNVFTGYHNNEAATRECLDRDGWFRTGDVGFIEGDGNLYITDRVKELIKYKGFQVAPAELEGYLMDHELVDDVAVVGVQDVQLATEVPRAYVVRKGGPSAVQQGDDKAIIDWLAGRVANHKKLRGGVRFVDGVPKTASGKILRRVLRDQVKKEEAEEGERKNKAGGKPKAKL